MQLPKQTCRFDTRGGLSAAAPPLIYAPSAVAFACPYRFPPRHVRPACSPPSSLSPRCHVRFPPDAAASRLLSVLPPIAPTAAAIGLTVCLPTDPDLNQPPV